MKRQTGFAKAENTDKKRATKRQRFLAEMEKMVPLRCLLPAIEPYYPKGQRDRPPIGRKRVLRIYCLKQWNCLSDEKLENAPFEGIPTCADFCLCVRWTTRSTSHSDVLAALSISCRYAIVVLVPENRQELRSPLNSPQPRSQQQN